ncbi:YppF family protein [Ammoniphilus sp. 3BR4]|uniref:YppF family protein n=1 Tax=Ammoniphilus sp. 3BR4 TaxID=3158265 RepID=UPI003466AF0F
MTLETLIHNFIQVKEVKPSNINELLDFIQRSYISEELSLSQYRELFKGLHERGAEKPIYFSDSEEIEESTVIL